MCFKIIKFSENRLNSLRWNKRYVKEDGRGHQELTIQKHKQHYTQDTERRGKTQHRQLKHENYNLTCRIMTCFVETKHWVIKLYITNEFTLCIPDKYAATLRCRPPKCKLICCRSRILVNHMSTVLWLMIQSLCWVENTNVTFVWFSLQPEQNISELIIWVLCLDFDCK